jgi:ArsR family transcriptional regulator, arsenate/arsenite/antimonite-responsive transcriptional repressor
MRTTTARSNTTRHESAVTTLHPVRQEPDAPRLATAAASAQAGHAPEGSWQGARDAHASRSVATQTRRRGADDRQMTKIFKALSDTTRQQILELLEQRERNVGEIVCNFNLSQPTISRHLSVLKEADLVVDQRQGQNVIYRLNEETLSNSMLEFFARFASCQAVLR